MQNPENILTQWWDARACWKKRGHATPELVIAMNNNAQQFICQDICDTDPEGNGRSFRQYNRIQPGGRIPAQLERDKNRAAGAGDLQRIEIVLQHV